MVFLPSFSVMLPAGPNSEAYFIENCLFSVCLRTPEIDRCMAPVKSVNLYGTLGYLVKKFARKNSVPNVYPSARNKVVDQAKLIRLVVKLHMLIKHKLKLRKSQFCLDIIEKFLTTKTWYGSNIHRHYY